MKSLIFTLCILLTVTFTLSAACDNIMYVKTDSSGVSGDGSSWANAYLDIQSALDKAEAYPDIQEVSLMGLISKVDDVSGRIVLI